MTKEKHPIASAFLKIPETIKELDGLDIGTVPHLIAFRHNGNFHLVRSEQWTAEESLVLISVIGPEAEELFRLLDDSATKNYVR